jgi:iron complex transport system substrate-binding protein
MRVVTLLPAATEIVAALGAGSRLVGISHECDFPPEIRGLPRLTTTPLDPAAPGPAIDEDVRRLQAAGLPVIAVDRDGLRRLAPDLIITQDLCEVCAVAEGEVHRLAAALDPEPAVLSLRANTLAGIYADIRAVGRSLDLEADADELVAGLDSRLRRLRTPTAERQRTICLEWLEPLYLAGHWVPELTSAAGGVDVGASPGRPSIRGRWAAVEALAPDLVLVALCGFGVERARAELDRLDNAAGLRFLRQRPTWVIDGSAYTSRAGPRVIDGAERIHAALVGREMPGLVRWGSRH